MTPTEALRAWKNVLVGRPPSLSIEITKECPLSCPGCYAYNAEHLGGDIVLNQVSDYKGQDLVNRFMELVNRHQPIHVAIVGGEPLVRFRELNDILPQLNARGIRIQLVTSAVRPIPIEWAKYETMTIAVSVDGLQPEHDVRRKPATYERILKNIEGHKIRVHCTVTRQMTERAGYLREFLDFWSPRQETEKIWISLFTPQIGETSYEILPKSARTEIVRELLELRAQYPKLAMPEALIKAFSSPPADPSRCLFAKSTLSMTADLKSRVQPCQLGGNPDCSQCGCIASVGLHAVGQHKLPGGLRLGTIYDASFKVGKIVASLRGQN